jgi:hypothetical protein
MVNFILTIHFTAQPRNTLDGVNYSCLGGNKDSDVSVTGWQQKAIGVKPLDIKIQLE